MNGREKTLMCQEFLALIRMLGEKGMINKK